MQYVRFTGWRIGLGLLSAERTIKAGAIQLKPVLSGGGKDETFYRRVYDRFYLHTSQARESIQRMVRCPCVVCGGYISWPVNRDNGLGALAVTPAADIEAVLNCFDCKNGESSEHHGIIVKAYRSKAAEVEMANYIVVKLTEGMVNAGTQLDEMKARAEAAEARVRDWEQEGKSWNGMHLPGHCFELIRSNKEKADNTIADLESRLQAALLVVAAAREISVCHKDWENCGEDGGGCEHLNGCVNLFEKALAALDAQGGQE